MTSSPTERDQTAHPTAQAPGYSVSTALVIGGGPAGLMAAQELSRAGHDVVLIERMPTVGRKLLRAGVGGLNLTHAEPFEPFVQRYGKQEAHCRRWLNQWGPKQLIAWAEELGIQTFVGSSQRVFPVGMKAAPLLRSWMRALQGGSYVGTVQVLTRHQWTGELRCVTSEAGSSAWQLGLNTPDGPITLAARAVVLALGGASWPQLGADGAWVPWLKPLGVEVVPLVPANCGFDVDPISMDGPKGVALDGKANGAPGWSAYFADRHAGSPIKTVVLRFTNVLGQEFCQRGELVLTRTGIEGSLVYAASAQLRDVIATNGRAQIYLDLMPDWPTQRVAGALEQNRKGRSLSWVLKSKLGLTGMHSALLHEVLTREVLTDAQALALAIKQLPMVLCQTRPLAEAISTAGGVSLEALTEELMVRHQDGVFMAGEMLDWEAPTGGYLLTASLSGGWVAGRAAAKWLAGKPIRAER